MGVDINPKVRNQMIVKGNLHNQTSNSVKILIDTSGGSSFVGGDTVRAHNLSTFPLIRKTIVEAFEGSKVTDITHSALVPVHIDGHLSHVYCFVTDLSNVDVILGTPWIAEHDPKFDWARDALIFNSEYCHRNCLWLKNGEAAVGHCIHAKTKMPPDVRGAGIRYYNDIEVAAVSAYHMQKLLQDSSFNSCILTEEDWEYLDCPDRDLEHRHIEAMNIKLAGSKVLPDDFAKFKDKLDCPPPSKQEILNKLPACLHSLADAFDPCEADKLPPHRNIDHRFELVPGSKPPTSRLRGMSRQEAEAIRMYVEDMLAKGQVRRSSSRFSAPLLVARKPGGGIRICVDYRGLNEITVKNRNSPPLMRDILNRISRKRWLSKVDVIAAFNKIRIKEGHEQYTAFLTSFGLFEYTVLPFGLCNAPATFQAYINKVLHGYLDEICSAYLDDVIIYSDTEEEHDRHLCMVIQKLRDAGLWLDIHKSEFKVQEVKFLGLILTPEGLKMDPEKTQAIQNWATPQTLKDLQAFIGFANFYRRFIAGFTKILRPLLDLVKKGNRKLDGWNLDHDKSFTLLKEAFTRAPILAHFDPNLPTILETDASDWVYAAVLSQKHEDGKLYPVVYLSKKMSPAETNYEIYDKELLAIVRAFEEWRPELAGTPDPVEILTDHKGLEYFKTKKHLNQRQMRWAEFLSQFDFRIKYRPGAQGQKPDALTRRPGDVPLGIDKKKDRNVILLPADKFDSHEAVRLAYTVLKDDTWTVAEIAYAMMLDLQGFDVEPDRIPLLPITVVENTDPYDEMADPEAQTIQNILDYIYPRDQILGQIMEAKERGDSRIPQHLIKQGIRIELGDIDVRSSRGVTRDHPAWKDTRRLYIKTSRQQERLVVLFSERLKTRIVADFHEGPVGGHAGRNELYERVSAWYYWQNMTDTISQYTTNCVVCRRTKANRTAKQGLLHPLPIPRRYWHDISVDFITSLPPSTWMGRTYTAIMVTVDRLTKKQKYVPLVDLEVTTVVDAFIEYIWREEGFPRTVVSDRGRQFTSFF